VDLGALGWRLHILYPRPDLHMIFRTRRTADRPHRPSRAKQRIFAAIAATVIISVGATAHIIVWPAQGMPASVSAIVMLAGPGNRLPVALQLAREHRAPVLVVSRGSHGYGGPCPPAPSGVKLICFEPNPGNTRGEAEFAGRMAKRYGWSSVALVTSRPQATRARMLMNRCFSGPVYVITASMPLGSWPYEIAYGWGALGKAFVMSPAC
jgi:hypothetical protein